MAVKMGQFTRTGQAQPDKRKPHERNADFGEIYRPFSLEGAAEQASRCEQCGIPYCQIHCPVQNNIPDWLMLAAEGRLWEAYQTSQATNNLPEICGRICPQDRLCEGGCVLEQSGHGAVTIGSVEKHINETAWQEGWVKPVRPAAERGESVSIVGAGPGGLAAAEQLRRHGYQVTVYDRHDRVGGLLIYGIPGFKLDKTVVQRRADLLAQAGVTFRLNFDVGNDATVADLRGTHDAVILMAGVYRARGLRCPGAGLDGVIQALPFLTASNRKDLGDSVPEFDDGTLNARGKRVVVVGGGDTAMDCVRTAVREGATAVTCLYRRDRANMPGSQREVEHAEEEGVTFEWLAAPEAVLGDDRVRGVRVVRMHLGQADASGRKTPQPVEGSQFDLDADMVITALGFEPEDVPKRLGAPDVKTGRHGTVLVDHRSGMTSMDGVFAGGDVVRGASLVVWAIRDGRDVAEGVHQHLTTRAARAQAS